MEKKVSTLLNDQIEKEFYSAYLYLDIANYYEEQGLEGFANWFEIQAKEEQDHAMLIYHYMHDNDQKVTLKTIDKPDGKYKTIADPLKATLDHEKFVTESIHAIYAAAQKANDYRTMQFLDWFVKEQGEEEKNANDLINKMTLFGNDPKSLYMLNSELASRVYQASTMVD